MNQPKVRITKPDMSMHDTTPSAANREEMLSRREADFTEHEVAYTKIGDWILRVRECVNDDTGELKERTWGAVRASDVKGLAPEEEWSEDLLTLVEFLISLMRPVDAEAYRAYLIVADLHVQMDTYWIEFMKERGAA